MASTGYETDNCSCEAAVANRNRSFVTKKIPLISLEGKNIF